MKKKSIDIVNVQKSFEKLLDLRVKDIKLAIKISKAYKEIKEHNETYSKQESMMIQKYGLKNEKGEVIIEKDKYIKFACVEDAENYVKEQEALRNSEVDIFDEIEIKTSDLLDASTITASLIYDLDGFVKFVE